MNSSSESALVAQHTSRALTRSLQPVLLFILVIFLAMVSSRSAMAAEPPNADHPPSRTVSVSPALRTSRTRNALRPQSDTGWYYADDSRHWYYQVPNQSTSLFTTAPPSASPVDAQDSASTLLKTGWHHDIDGFTYYFDPSDGHMLAGSHTIDGIEYSFLPERDRGNYHQDNLGAWFYRANGLAPYGSLLNSRSRNKRHSSPAATRPTNTDCDKSLIDSEDLVTDRLTIPPKASPSELTRDDDQDAGTTATPSELPRDDDSAATPPEIPREDDTPATPSEPPRSEDTPPAAPDPDSPDPVTPPESPDPESPDPAETPDPPAPPSDDRDHAHTSDPSVHCIATDDWSTILANRDAYGDCIENHCTALLYLSGPPVSQPPASPETTTQDYPLYVSLVDDCDDQLTFAQAYAIPALSDVPMYVGTSLHDSESTPTYKQTNLGGICDTWLFRTLIGTGTNSPFRFYLKKEDGTYSQHEFTYPGYQIRIPDADKNCGVELLPLQSMKKYISRGYQAETPGVERNLYTTYLSNERKTLLNIDTISPDPSRSLRSRNLLIECTGDFLCQLIRILPPFNESASFYSILECNQLFMMIMFHISWIYSYIIIYQERENRYTLLQCISEFFLRVTDSGIRFPFWNYSSVSLANNQDVVIGRINRFTYNLPLLLIRCAK